MKAVRTDKLVIRILAIMLLIVLLGSSYFVITDRPSYNSSLQFQPLILVGPRIASQGKIPTCPVTLLIHCYTPSQIYAAYGIDKLQEEGLTGKGETIVIIDAYGSPTALSDLQTFSKAFDLPVPNSSASAPTFTIVHPTGIPTFNPAMFGVQASWAFETSLDIEWAHAIAPDANIVLIATNPAETEGVQGFPSILIGIQFAVAHYPGSVISQSFAATEQSFEQAAPQLLTMFTEVYQEAASEHITVFGSAGDSGTTNVIGGEGVSPAKVLPFPTVNWPASDPYVTAAGGTWLQYGWTWDPTVSASTFYSCLSETANFNECAEEYLAFNTTGPTRTEAVWKEDWLPAAGGGGLSSVFPTPPFQNGISSTLLKGKRGLPDVSWNAAVDGGVLVYVSFPGTKPGFYPVGGTSAASPQLAGLIALTNQLADEEGKQHVGYLNPLLYKLPSSAFNDVVPYTFGTGQGVVTLDTNALYGSSVPGFPVTQGWDLATGFGSPNAPNFVNDLVNMLPSK